MIEKQTQQAQIQGESDYHIIRLKCPVPSQKITGQYMEEEKNAH